MELHELHQNTTPPPVKEKRPPGMYILSFLFSFKIFGLLMSFLNPILIIGVKVITGLPVILYNLTMTAVVIFIISGILMRKKWAFFLILGYEIYSMLIFMMSLIYFGLNQESSYALMNEVSGGAISQLGTGFIKIIMIMTTFFTLGVGLTIILYVIKRKEYFSK